MAGDALLVTTGIYLQHTTISKHVRCRTQDAFFPNRFFTPFTANFIAFIFAAFSFDVDAFFTFGAFGFLTERTDGFLNAMLFLLAILVLIRFTRLAHGNGDPLLAPCNPPTALVE